MIHTYMHALQASCLSGPVRETAHAVPVVQEANEHLAHLILAHRGNASVV